jgi:hypothetical protein
LEIDSRCLKPYEEEYWRGLSAHESDLLDVSTFARTAAVDFHQACWLVAISAPGLQSGSEEFVRRFCFLAQDTSGSLPPIPSSAEPMMDLKSIQKSTAYKIFASKQEQRSRQSLVDACAWIYRLPLDMIDRIFWELRDFQDIGRFSLATGLFPSDYVLSKLMTRAFGSEILEEERTEYPVLLINMTVTPKLISHSLSNYLLIIRRTIDIMDTLQDLRIESNSIGCVDGPATLTTVPVASSAWTFYFVRVATLLVLAGIDFGTSVLGFQHGQAFTVSSDLSALRFVQNDLGITSVQRRTTGGWRYIAPDKIAQLRDHRLHISYCTEIDAFHGCSLACEVDV